MFMVWKSKECPDDLARKCSVPGTFFTSTKPAQISAEAKRCRIDVLDSVHINRATSDGV